MLSAYLDESGTHKGSRICAMGCLVASPAQWERLSRAWLKVLDAVGVPDFHATDCANGAQAFKGWEPKDRDKLFIRLANLTVRMTAFRVWTAVVMEDYHRFFSDLKERFPYSLCALGCAARLRHIAVRRGSGFVIPYVFDQGPKGKRAFATFDRMSSKDKAHYFRMGALTKADRLQMVPLQVADLHAYEVYRYFSDQMTHGRRTMREPFRQLLRISDGGGYLLTGPKLDFMTREVLRQRRENVLEEINIPLDHLNRNEVVVMRYVSGTQSEETA